MADLYNGQKDTKSAGNTDPNKVKEEIGRAQKAYNEYMSKGRSDLAQNSADYANSQRDLYAKNGGNADDVKQGMDFRDLYKGNNAGAYDPNKAGEQTKTAAPAPKAAPTYAAPSNPRPDMKQGMSFADALAQAKAKYEPLRQDSLHTLGTQYQTDRGNVDQAAAGRGVGHSGLAVNAITNLAAGNSAAIAKANAMYDSNAAGMATDLQKDDRNFNFQKWNADNANWSNDRNFGYQQYRDGVGDTRYDNKNAYDQYRDTVGDQRYQQNWDRQGSQIDWQKQMQEAGMTGKWNGNWTQQARQAYAQMMGVDPVTGKPTFSREQFDTNTSLRREQMAQQAALAQARLAASQKPTSSPDSMYWALNASGVPSTEMGKVLLQMGVPPEQINGVQAYYKSQIEPVTKQQFSDWNNAPWDHWSSGGDSTQTTPSGGTYDYSVPSWSWGGGGTETVPQGVQNWIDSYLKSLESKIY